MRALLLLFLLSSHHAFAAPFDLVVCGSGGQPEYSRRFAGWGERLERVLREVLRHPPENVVLLTESTPSSLEQIGASLDRLAARLRPDDVLFVFLIGHGSFRQGEAKLNIPGPDLEALALGRMLEKVPATRLVLVNAASSSAPFINALSAPGRVLCTSTSSAEQNNAAWFMEHFLQALEEGSADRDRDERISVLEACTQAAQLTRARYLSGNLLETEHALLDDDGDGLGSRILPGEEGGKGSDGALAERTFLRDFHFPPEAAPALVEAYLQALRQVELWIGQKQSIDPEPYYRRLEDLLLEAARLNREIRAAESAGRD